MSDSAERQPLNSATRAVLVNHLPEPHQQPQFNRNLAVVIGIDAYTGGIPRLTTAVNDAARLAELLADDHGYETVLLTQPATGQPVTRERLRALFEDELKARLGDDDRLLVYFAGHGVALDGDDGPRGYLVPQDARPGDSASMLAMTDLHAWLTDLPCRHMLAILDCCFAGAFRWAATRHLGALPDVIHQERYDRYLLSPAWQVLTSAAYDQKALDVLDGKTIGVRENDGTPHSPFAQALIDALEKGAADLVPKGQGDGVITATELYLYLREQVEVQAEEQASHEQTPGLWPLNKHRKGEFIFLTPGHPLNLPAAPDLTTEFNPYRGLKSYDQKHAPLFFGREDEIKELVALVEQQPFLAVLGASGTGKSSLVKAGLLPRLEVRSDDFSRPAPAEATEVATTNDGYHALPPMRPTDQPLRALAALLAAELAADFRSLGDFGSLDGDDVALAQIIARWAATHHGQRLVLTIDQFEELATLCRDDAERERFLVLLATAVKEQPAAFRLIITLRTDFEPQFTQEDSPLAGLWQAGRYIVPPMDIEDLRQVIEGPASVRVLYFDPPELVDDLIKEVIQTPGALPLLSFTLSELYVKYVRSGRDDRALAGADYKALGGVVGSLRNRATEEYDRLPDDAYRLTMQRAMLRMVAVEGGELARRRVALSELDYPTAEENARVQAVLDRLVDARLLVRGTSDPSPGSGQVTDGTKGEAYVEPAHDALVLAWDRLLRWKQEAEEYLPLQRRLAQAAGEWIKATPEAKSGLLWDDDPRLPQVEETLWPTDRKQKGLAGRIHWVKQVLVPQTNAPADTRWLNAAELTFVQTSVQRRASTLRRIMGIGLAVIIVVGALVSFGLYTQRQSDLNARTAATEKGLKEDALVARATAVAAQAETERLKRGIQADQLTVNALKVADENPELALLLAVEGLRAQSDVTTTAAITEPITPQTTRPITRTDIVSETVVSSAQTNVHELLRRVHGVPMPGYWPVVFSPDKRWIAQGTQDNRVLVWNAAYPDADPIVLHCDGVGSFGLSFSPDGRYLASADSWGFGVIGAAVWDLEKPDTSPIILPDAIEPISFSPDGRWIATGVISRTFSSSDSSIGTVSATFAEKSVSRDSVVALWNFADPAAPAYILRGHTDQPGELVFSPDSRWLATAGQGDARAYLWDLGNIGTKRLIYDLSGIIHSTNGLAFSPDSRWLAAGLDAWPVEGEGNMSAAVLFDVTDPQAEPAVIVEPGEVHTLTFSPDGSWLAVAIHKLRYSSGDDVDTVDLWPMAGNPDCWGWWNEKGYEGCPQISEITGHEGRINSLAFSPDGRWLASGSYDKTVRLSDLEAEDPAAAAIVLRGHEGSVENVSFSSDGNWLATYAGFGDSRLWDVGAATATAPTSALLPTSAAEIAAFSPDGRWLATASGLVKGERDREPFVRLWDARALAQNVKADPIILTGNDGPIDTVAISPDNHWLATGSGDGTARLWNLDTVDPRANSIELLRQASAIAAMAFSSENHWLAIGSGDGAVRLWRLTDPDPNRTSAELRPPADAAISAVAFSPDGHWLAVGSEDNKALLWNLQTSDPAASMVELHGENSSIRALARALAFSPTGDWLATGSDDGAVRLWNMRATDPSAAPAQLAGHSSAVGITSVAFSPDGRWLVTTSRDLTARLWDLQAQPIGSISIPLRGHTNTVYTAAFTPDSLWLATGSSDGTARLWDVRALMRDANTLPVVLQSPGSSLHVAFGGDGRWLATSTFGAARVWAWRVEDVSATACHYVGRNLKLDEWMRYFPDRPYRRTCPQWPGHSSVTQELRDNAYALGKQGHIADAVTKFREAVALDPHLSSNSQDSRKWQWEALCWYGATRNQAGLVLDICDTAVKLAPDVPEGPTGAHRLVSARDSRGVARALTGDIAGAIEDFEYVIAEEGWLYKTRPLWVRALQEGQYPVAIFDMATLDRLRNEKAWH